MPPIRPMSSELSSQESVNGDVKMSSHSQTAPSHSNEPLHHQASRDALQYSADASRYLQEQEYNLALTSYQQALYLYQSQHTVVGQCNAAATLHNMALLHKKCLRYDDSIQCFKEAEDLYRDCAGRVKTRVSSSAEEGQVCLEYLLVETLHNRAFVHSKYQRNVSRAISCHEQVVETILGMDDNGNEASSQREEPPDEQDEVVVYVKMNNQQRVALLSESLKSLGVFYSQKGETQGALGALEEALEVLKCQVAECPEDVPAKKSMATVLITLASVYFGQEEFAEALEALQHAMDIWMDVEEDPARTDVLATVNNMGLAHERMGNLDKALECYEDLLHVRSQVLGSDHVEVADSLTTVAKVLDRQGNTEGALDLYQEALRIYKQSATVDDPSLWAHAAHVLGRIGTIVLEMGQVDESIEKFNEALQMDRHTLGQTSEETASIHHGLGRAHMQKGDYDEARECLLKAARMLEAVPNDDVHLDSLVESSEMLTRALNNESFLSSDGTWVNAEIDIEKTPERLAFASSMSPIGESSLSGDPSTTEDESPSDNFSSSSMSSQLPPRMQVYVHPSAPAVDSSIEIEMSPLTACHKQPPSSPERSKNGDIDEDFDPYLTPASHESVSQSSDTGSIAIDSRQLSVLDTVDIGSPLRQTASGHGQEAVLNAGPSDECDDLGPAQPDLNLSQDSEPSWAAALALANEATLALANEATAAAAAAASQAPSHVVEAAQVDVSALASPTSGLSGPLVQEKFSYATADQYPESESAEESEQEELHRGLMMEFSEYESESELGTNTADYTNSSRDETDDYTNGSDDVDTADYDGETADYTTDLDTLSRQLSSVVEAETDLSQSFNTLTLDGESQSRLLGASIEESTMLLSELPDESSDSETADDRSEPSTSYEDDDGETDDPSQLSTTFDDDDNESDDRSQLSTSTSYDDDDVETDDRSQLSTTYDDNDGETEDRSQLSTTYGDESNSASGWNASTRYSPSGIKTEAAFFAPEGDAEDENDYQEENNYHRHLSTDNDEESDIFGTDLDTDNESVSLDDPHHDTFHDQGMTEPNHQEAPDVPPRKEIAQLAVSPRDEHTRRQFERTPSDRGLEKRIGRHVGELSQAAEAINAHRLPEVETGQWPESETQHLESDDHDEPLLASSGGPDVSPQSPREVRKSSPRVMLVKAFRHSFRRRRSSSRSRLDPMPEEKEHNDPSTMLMSDHGLPSQTSMQGAAPSFDSTAASVPIGPIKFVDLQAEDDNVSQITFLQEETSVRRRDRSGGSWWWGASSEGLEGWFPAVVGAAEEFLSAKTIHDQIKSGKRRESSSSSTDDDSDIFGDLSVEKEDTIHKDEVHGNQSQGDDGAENDVMVKAGQETDGLADAGSPVISEVKTSTDRVAKSPATNKPVVPSSNASTRRRSSSSRTRKIQELENALEDKRSLLGRKHPDVAEALTAIAVLKSQDGETDAPVELLHEALHIRKTVGDRAEFARTLHKLGDVYARQKEFKSALSCHTDALHLERLVYGYHHPEVAKTLNRIGSVYAGQGDFGVAISNHQHALQILKDCIGEDVTNPLVAQTLICIGAVYYKERNSLETIRAKSDGYNTFIEAGMLDVIARAHEQRGSYRMAIAFFEEKLHLLRNQDKRGMDKQEVADALTRLGTLSREAGLYLEALDYYDEAATLQSALGRDQVEIAKGRLLKGTVLYYLGQYKGALKLAKEAQAILQATVGKGQQVLIAETFQWIGIIETEMCDYESAMTALETALKIETKALGTDHPTTLKSRLAIAIVLLHQAEMDKSIVQLTAILETQGRVHGPKHPNLAETMYHIGRAYEMKGDIASAMKFFEESFFMAEKYLGHDHPSQASTLHCIADLQRQKRRYKKSLQLLLSVLTMRKDTLGEGHVTVAMTLCSIGSCHAATGRFAESTKVLDEALQVAECAVGKTHPYTGLIHVTNGNLLLRKCQFEQARTTIERGLEIYISSNVAMKHPYRLEAEDMLERVERDEALFV